MLSLALQLIPEPLYGQTFISELVIEALVGSVLPRLTRRDQGRLKARIHGPTLWSLADEPRAVVHEE